MRDRVAKKSFFEVNRTPGGKGLVVAVVVAVVGMASSTPKGSPGSPSCPGTESTAKGGKSEEASLGTQRDRSGPHEDTSALDASGGTQRTRSGPKEGTSKDVRAPSGHSQRGGQRAADREARRAAAKEKEEEIMTLLFPTDGLKKDFKNATGGHDPNPQRLLQDVEFRDRLRKLGDKPSVKGIKELRILAVNIQGKKRTHSSQQPTRRDSSKSSKMEVDRATTSSKRKNRSFSTERSGEERETPKSSLPKIPRITSTPPAEAAQTATKGNEDEVLDEDELPSLEELSQALDEEGGERSYAEAAGTTESGRTSRKDYPYLLYVHTGDEERRTMSRKTWDLFLKEVTKAHMDLALKTGSAPFSEWRAFKRGVGFFAILDKESQMQMKKLIADVRVAEYTFRGWAKGETGKFTPLTTILPAETDGTPAGKIMQVIACLNGLQESTEANTHYIVRSCEARKGGKGRILRVGVSKEWMERLEAKKLQVFLGPRLLEFRTAAGAPASPKR